MTKIHVQKTCWSLVAGFSFDKLRHQHISSTLAQSHLCMRPPIWERQAVSEWTRECDSHLHVTPPPNALPLPGMKGSIPPREWPAHSPINSVLGAGESALPPGDQTVHFD